jgi:hypothetical protein
MPTQAELDQVKAEAQAQTHAVIGWAAVIAAVGMLLGSIGQEVAALPSWAQAVLPAFVGKILIHVGAVVGAFVAGQYMPSPRERKDA